MYRPSSTQANHIVHDHLDLVFTNHNRYCFQICVDDNTRFLYIDVMEDKSSVFEKWVELKKLLDNRHAPFKTAYVRTDSDFVYTSKDWFQHDRDEGYEHEFSSSHRHDRNPVTERVIQSIGVVFRCMMFQGGAPESDAPYALMHANVVHNNSPTVANQGHTPKEKELGVRFPVNNRLLRAPLFCLFYAHVFAEECGKGDERTIPCVYMGFDDDNDSFIAKEWATVRIMYTVDGDFHPKMFPYRTDPRYSVSWVREHDSVFPTGEVSNPNPALHAVPARRSERHHDYLWSGGRRLDQISDEDVDPEPEQEDQLINFVHNFGPDPDNWEEALRYTVYVLCQRMDHSQPRGN